MVIYNLYLDRFVENCGHTKRKQKRKQNHKHYFLTKSGIFGHAVLIFCVVIRSRSLFTTSAVHIRSQKIIQLKKACSSFYCVIPLVTKNCIFAVRLPILACLICNEHDYVFSFFSDTRSRILYVCVLTIFKLTTPEFVLFFYSFL